MRILILLSFLTLLSLPALADPAPAVDIAALKARAEQGDAKAADDLGTAYFNGTGVDKSDTEAFKWISKSAEEGYAEAQADLGELYAVGKGVKQDFGLSAQWLRKGAEANNPEAQINLGAAYENGRGVPKDYKEAYFWFLVAYKTVPNMVTDRDEVAKHLNKDQIDDVKKRAKDWKPATAPAAAH